MKTCTKCGEEKPLDDYARDGRASDGRTSSCKACHSVAARKKYAANQENGRARARAYRAEHREQAAKYRATNAERIREYMANYHAENREELAAYHAAYYARNRERISAQRSSRPHVGWESSYRQRAEKFGFEAMVIPFTRDDLIARYGDACVHCGGPFEHLDHHPVPVRLGGPHSLDNCVPSCAPCNTRESYAIRIAHRTHRPTA